MLRAFTNVHLNDQLQVCLYNRVENMFKMNTNTCLFIFKQINGDVSWHKEYNQLKLIHVREQP